MIVESDSAAEARQSAENEAKQREIEDLIAQQGMDAATQRMANYTHWSTILVGISVALIFWTLHLTSVAARAAKDTLEQARLATEATINTTNETRRIGEAQTKAYLGFIKGTYCFDENGLYFSPVVKNFGRSPARGIHMTCMLNFTGGNIFPHLHARPLLFTKIVGTSKETSLALLPPNPLKS